MTAAFSMPGGAEWIVIALVVLLLFGGKKIPELMRGLGKGVRSFKEGLNDAGNEIKSAADEARSGLDGQEKKN
ncbi:MAG: twin-arginine translocase TatA/TatE family subunit [Muribaculaceae bacterium]|nr:twin-arginine translocase TatA/TatE family subunit [Muribaculaceae bacterium]